MQVNLTVSGEILSTLFEEDYNVENHHIRIAKSRLHKHRLLFNDELIEYWESYFLEKKPDLLQIFQNWMTQLSSVPSKYEYVQSTVESNNILVDTAKNISNSVVIDDIEISLIKQYKNLRFCKIKDFYEHYNSIIKMDSIKKFIEGGVYINNIFNHLDIPITIKVESNQVAEDLSKYLSIFLKDSKYLIIRDKFFEKNYINYEKYLKKHISNDIEVTVYSAEFEDPDLRKKLQQKYGIKLICRTNDHIHRGEIENQNYLIKSPLRLAIFGDSGKTHSEDIIINYNESLSRVPERVN